MTIKRITLLCLLGAFLPVLAAELSPVLAVSMDKSSRTKECAVMIGADAIQVSGYEPDVSQDKYCEEFPSTNFRVYLGAPGGWGALKAKPLFGRPPKLDGPIHRSRARHNTRLQAKAQSSLSFSNV